MQIGEVERKDYERITRVFEVSVDEAVHLVRVNGYWSCGSHREREPCKRPRITPLD